MQRSASYSVKNGLPILKHVIWPRYGAFEELVDSRVGVTHIVDLTVMYLDPQNQVSLFNILRGDRKESVKYFFRVFEVDDSPVNDGSVSSSDREISVVTREELNREWLQNLWIEKEEIMENFYSNREKFYLTHGLGRRVQLSYSKIFLIYLIHLFLLIIPIIYLFYHSGHQAPVSS